MVATTSGEQSIMGRITSNIGLITGIPITDTVDQLIGVAGAPRDLLSSRNQGLQQQQLAIARALVTRPRLLVLDEPTEGIQPSIIKDIERVIRILVGRGNMAILLVEQYFEFAQRLADAYAVMDRGEIVIAGRGEDMVEEDVHRHITV